MPKILVYDDHKWILELYRREFQDEGYEVLPAASLREALRYFRAESPELVLLSIRQPGAEVLGTLEQLLTVNRRTPIVFTGAFIDHAAPGLAQLADAEVEQESDLTMLKQTIRDLCPNYAPERVILSKPSQRRRAVSRTAV